MGDLRIKACELLQFNRDKEEFYKKLSKERNQEEKRIKSMQKFQEKMVREIEGFQNNLLNSADRGETLKIDIIELDKENLISWWDERENNIDTNKDYSPIKSEIITFIDDINLRFLTDSIIIDKSLQKLYDTIRDNDIYPEWGVRKNRSGDIVSLYLEANPLISYTEKKASLDREKAVKNRALVVVDANDGIKNSQKFSFKTILKSLLTFLTVLYFSVVVLTLLSSAVGLTEAPNNIFLEIGWPYFLISNFSDVGAIFTFSLPLGILLALYSIK